MKDARIRAVANELSRGSNLEPYLENQIEGLSHGTRQRVAIASALLHAPEVSCLTTDGWTRSASARVLRTSLKEKSRQGMTIFISSHQLSVAEEMADRIGINSSGRLGRRGTREELRRQSGQDARWNKASWRSRRRKPTLREKAAAH